MKINFPLKEIAANIGRKLEELQNPEYLIRPVAQDLVVLMTQRIHDEGKASDDSAIGNYSNAYLKLRESKYNRTADTKVVISLTRQLENDWSVVAIDKGYGIGFKNAHNRDKSRWVEATYNKPIFSLSKSEQQYAQQRWKELIQDALSL